MTASRHRSITVTTSIADSGRSAGDGAASANENCDVEKGSNDKKEAERDNSTKNVTDDDDTTTTTTTKQSSSHPPTTPTSVFDTSRHGAIFLPPAGHDCHNSTCRMRQESGICAICLSVFIANDCISWSSNAACPHLFHAACIQDWLVAVGRKHVARAVFHGNLEEEDVDKTVLTNFPMLCPCCRRPFILVDSTLEASATSSETTNSEQAERDASASEMSSNGSSHDGGEVTIPTAAAAADNGNTQLPSPTGTRGDAVAEVAINQV